MLMFQLFLFLETGIVVFEYPCLWHPFVPTAMTNKGHSVTLKTQIQILLLVPAIVVNLVLQGLIFFLNSWCLHALSTQTDPDT